MQYSITFSHRRPRRSPPSPPTRSVRLVFIPFRLPRIYRSRSHRAASQSSLRAQALEDQSQAEGEECDRPILSALIFLYFAYFALLNLTVSAKS
jgi:hypothetical protein